MSETEILLLIWKASQSAFFGLLTQRPPENGRKAPESPQTQSWCVAGHESQLPLCRGNLLIFTAPASDDVPAVLCGMTELAARDTCGQTEVADGDLLVYQLVGEIVGAAGHSADEHAAALLRTQRVDVVPHTHERGVKTEGDLAAVGREVVRDGVGDDPEELLLGGGGADGEAVQQLHHQTGESLEGSGYPDRGRHFNKDALGRVDVNLESTRLVDRRINEGQ